MKRGGQGLVGLREDFGTYPEGVGPLGACPDGKGRVGSVGTRRRGRGSRDQGVSSAPTQAGFYPRPGPARGGKAGGFWMFVGFYVVFFFYCGKIQNLPSYSEVAFSTFTMPCSHHLRFQNILITQKAVLSPLHHLVTPRSTSPIPAPTNPLPASVDQPVLDIS